MLISIFRLCYIIRRRGHIQRKHQQQMEARTSRHEQHPASSAAHNPKAKARNRLLFQNPSSK